MADRKRIVVAEEAKTLRERVGFLLSNHGYEVTGARSGCEAIRLVRTLAPDLAVPGADLRTFRAMTSSAS